MELKFIEKIYNYEITLDEAIEDQIKLEILINKLNNNYSPRSLKKIEQKNKVLEFAKKLFDAREDIIGLLKMGTLPYKGDVFKTKQEKSEEESKEKIKDDF